MNMLKLKSQRAVEPTLAVVEPSIAEQIDRIVERRAILEQHRTKHGLSRPFFVSGRPHAEAYQRASELLKAAGVSELKLPMLGIPSLAGPIAEAEGEAVWVALAALEGEELALRTKQVLENSALRLPDYKAKLGRLIDTIVQARALTRELVDIVNAVGPIMVGAAVDLSGGLPFGAHPWDDVCGVAGRKSGRVWMFLEACAAAGLVDRKQIEEA